MISACPPYIWGDSSTIEDELAQCTGTVQRYRGDSSTAKEALPTFKPSVSGIMTSAGSAFCMG
jgi:hypothetical protein